jgi:hypothetical protein
MCEPKQSGPPIAESDVNVNDVLCGRGTKYCNQLGNKMYHNLVKHFILDYATARNKTVKTEISKAIVDAVRNATPVGRFLTQSKDGVWFEIGDKKSREKTSQLLRETVMIGQTNHTTMYQKKKDDKAKSGPPTMTAFKIIRRDSMMASKGKRPPLSKVSGNTVARMSPSLKMPVTRCHPSPLHARLSSPSSVIPHTNSIVQNKARSGSESFYPYPAPHGSTYSMPQNKTIRPQLLSCPASHGSASLPLVHNPKDNSRSSFYIAHRPTCAAGVHPPTTQFNSSPPRVYNPQPPISGSCCVSCLSREINTWTFQPSRATLAELEAIAQFQDHQQRVHVAHPTMRAMPTYYPIPTNGPQHF